MLRIRNENERVYFVIRVFACVYLSGFDLFSVRIGAVLENNTFYDESIQAFQYAVDEANEKMLQNTHMKLAIEIETLTYGREYAVPRCVCNLLEVIKLASKIITSNSTAKLFEAHYFHIYVKKKNKYISFSRQYSLELVLYLGQNQHLPLITS